MKIVTELTLTMMDGMEIQVDSLRSRFAVVLPDGRTFRDYEVPLLDLRDLLLAHACHSVLFYNVCLDGGVDFDPDDDDEDFEMQPEDPELVTISVFPKYIVNIIANDTEVALTV